MSDSEGCVESLSARCDEVLKLDIKKFLQENEIIITDKDKLRGIIRLNTEDNNTNTWNLIHDDESLGGWLETYFYPDFNDRPQEVQDCVEARIGADIDYIRENCYKNIQIFENKAPIFIMSMIMNTQERRIVLLNMYTKKVVPVVLEDYCLFPDSVCSSRFKHPSECKMDLLSNIFMNSVDQQHMADFKKLCRSIFIHHEQTIVSDCKFDKSSYRLQEWLDDTYGNFYGVAPLKMTDSELFAMDDQKWKEIIEQTKALSLVYIYPNSDGYINPDASIYKNKIPASFNCVVMNANPEKYNDKKLAYLISEFDNQTKSKSFVQSLMSGGELYWDMLWWMLA